MKNYITMLLLLLATTAFCTSCGVKGKPSYPENSNYTNQYPAK